MVSPLLTLATSFGRGLRLPEKESELSGLRCVEDSCSLSSSPSSVCPRADRCGTGPVSVWDRRSAAAAMVWCGCAGGLKMESIRSAALMSVETCELPSAPGLCANDVDGGCGRRTKPSQRRP